MFYKNLVVLNPKVPSFTVTNNKEKQQILTFKKLGAVNVSFA